MATEDEYGLNPAKRRRISYSNDAPTKPVTAPLPHLLSPSASSTGGSPKLHSQAVRDADEDEIRDISLQANSKFAGQAVAPFLAEHIPDQYAPLGGNQGVRNPEKKGLNTKYCYRHRPDLKCRRQVDEPSMAQLQEVRAYQIANDGKT